MKFVVGDIHGEISKLKKLILHITSIDKTPDLIFIGDYLDKGEDVKQTLLYLIELSKTYSCTFILGNHEYLWMTLHETFSESSEYLIKYGGLQTVNSFQCKDVIETQKILMNEFDDFFSRLLPYWISDDVIVVHSGIKPENYSLNITSISIKNLLFNRYDFFSVESLYLDKYRVIFGHTGFYYPFCTEYRIGIDTAACFLEKQPLTAYCIDDHSFYNSEGLTYTELSIIKNVCPNIIRVKPWRYAD